MLSFCAFLLLQVGLLFAVSCPSGGIYDSNFDRCYVYFNKPTIFLQAEYTCRTIGGNLAVIRNGFENTYLGGVVNLLSNGTASTYWIGASLLLAPRWTWTTNETALFTNWSADEPSDPSSCECARVREDNYLWKKELCNAIHPFACSAPPIVSTTPNPSPCDPGYILYGGSCFRLFHFDSGYDYEDSYDFCQHTENASLPVIKTLGTQNFIQSSIVDKGNIWLGLLCYSASINNCAWSDLDFSKPDSYNNFAPGQPSGQGPIFMDAPSGHWYTGAVFGPNLYVMCEKPARNM